MRILIFILFLFISCSKELPEKEELIDQYYSVRVDALKAEKQGLCRANILDEAKTEIDSLIDRWINAQLLDTIKFPNKPAKPPKPEHIIDKMQKFEVDSTMLKN